jgi:hypothetical protein
MFLVWELSQAFLGNRASRIATKRALQTVIFYMRTCRDSATANWLERFLDLNGIDEYHGLDGLRKPWRDVVTDLLDEPPTTIVLTSVPRNRSGSGNNPFLPPKVLTMDFEINPQRIALRLLECSAEVSRECLSDLGKMAQENEAIRRSYQVRGNEKVRASTLPIVEIDVDSGDSKSAFRGGTYDLLKRLATREAVRATLAHYERERQAGAQAYLARFREAHGARLDGESAYNAHDDFLKALLAQMPSIGGAGPVDPARIANALLDEREVAAARWVEVLATMPADLQDLKRDFLEKGLR